MFEIACWKLWDWRNMALFDPTFIRDHQGGEGLGRYAATIFHAGRWTEPSMMKPRIWKEVGWTPPND